MKLDRITVAPEICRDRARVRGARITVDFVLKLISNGYTPAQVIDAYPELSLADVRQCASYGAWLASERELAPVSEYAAGPSPDPVIPAAATPPAAAFASATAARTVL